MVEREKPQRLRLSLKGQTLHMYDVFISYDPADLWWARVVFDALTAMRYRPILSDIAWRDGDESGFGKAVVLRAALPDNSKRLLRGILEM